MSLIYCGIKTLSRRNPAPCGLSAGGPVRRVRPQNKGLQAGKSREVNDEKVIGEVEGNQPGSESARQKPKQGDAIEGALPGQRKRAPGPRKGQARDQNRRQRRPACPPQDAMGQALIRQKDAAAAQSLSQEGHHGSQAERRVSCTSSTLHLFLRGLLRAPRSGLVNGQMTLDGDPNGDDVVAEH